MNNYKNDYMSKVGRTASHFSNFNGSDAVLPSGNTLNQLNRTYTVKIQNATNATASFVVFGYNENGDGAAAGSDAGINITIAQSSHAQVKRDTASNPVVLVMAKYSTTDAANFNNDITYRRKDSTGALNTIPVTPLNYQEPQNNISTLLVIPDFNGVLIDGPASFTGSINASTTITLVLTIKSKVNIGNAAYDENVQITTNQAAPSGNVPVVMNIVQQPNTTIPTQIGGNGNASASGSAQGGVSSFMR